MTHPTESAPHTFALVGVTHQATRIDVQSQFRDLGEAVVGAHSVLDANRRQLAEVQVMEGAELRYSTGPLDGEATL